MEALVSDVYNTPPSGGATPRVQSPAREDRAGGSLSGPLDRGSTDKGETPYTPPSSAPWPQQVDTAATDVLKINTYHFVRLIDFVRADTTERQGTGGGTDMADMPPTWPMEATTDMDTDEEPSDVPQRDDTAGYNWRADLTDNTYKYDKLVEQSGPDRSDASVTAAIKRQPMRTLTHWIDEIHSRGGEAARGRHLADSTISHHNSWERVASYPTYDTPSGI